MIKLLNNHLILIFLLISTICSAKEEILFTVNNNPVTTIDLTQRVNYLSFLNNLDINNIYVNSINHNYDAEDFMRALPKERIAYAHIAGHYNEDKDLLVDTHGTDVIDPVWGLLKKSYEYFDIFPTLLERDFNIPKLDKLLEEVGKIKSIQSAHSNKGVENV